MASAMPMDAGIGKQRRHDKFDLLAKEQGYRSRAAFKLLQLDTLFRFLPTARAVLDLCAAPGGWVQVAVSRAAPGAFVVGVDLAPIRPISGALSLKEDITASARCGAAVRRLMDSRGVASFEVVLHDGAGRKKKCGGTGASAAQEATTTQSALVMDAVRLATMFLAPNGTFITKFFRCQDYNAIMFCLKQLFERVHLSRPVASRCTPAEIYVICLRYKAPANIQPELLDLKHLHLMSVDAEKSKRQESTEFWKTGLASDFIWSEAQTPLDFLGSFLTISFDDPASLPMKNHELTTDEIKDLCEYLFVLRENGYNHLLKWRMRIRKALLSCSQVTLKADGTVTDSKGSDDDQLLHEVEDLKNIVDTKRMKVKHQSRPHAKGKAHKTSGMQIGATEDGYGDPDLFPICAIEGEKELHAAESPLLDLEEDIRNSENEETQALEDSGEEMDYDQEQQRYGAQVKGILDEAQVPFGTEKCGEVKRPSKHAKRTNPYGNTEVISSLVYMIISPKKD
ncbi:adoMet-dependent rRNA methyltransferase spb1-like [Hordeum vulgare subsp. vulgare]|uniref:adoMet-dependent rRNA methyltransferase spb1-like n=1 Tax=Hordeum vulgare subsp. vulgare TaxID=112509 RepID=UPI001D1A5508|nr:adoMet-dependent rRNA methyltransferase spb1-like [Hordeum vulgare subsp. vulgare]